jgi:DNA-binding Lrp family transcriptional regulator
MAKNIADSLDLMLLSELDLNARAPTVRIAKKMGKKNNWVKNRMRSLEERGIIKRYGCIPDVFRAGLRSYRIYMKQRHVNSTIEKEMMEHLCASPITTWCGFGNGKSDMTAFLAFGDHKEAVEFWNTFADKYCPYINKAQVTPFYGDVQTHLRFDDLASNSEPIITGLDRVKMDIKDRMLMRLLSTNCRAPLAALGKAVGLRPSSVVYRINNLVRRKLIKAFRPVIDFEKLGYTTYRVDFKLNSRKKLNEIRKYVLGKPGVSHLFHTLGWADVEIELFARSSKELNAMLHDISDQFPEDIREYELIEYLSVTKDNFLGALMASETP